MWLKIFRQAVIGLVLIAVSLCMVLYVGLLKKSYLEWRAAPKYHQGWYQNFAHRQANSINWLLHEHPVIFGIAPTFPPEVVGENPPFNWDFVKANWPLLCWIGMFYGGLWALGSANQLLTLISEVSREEKKEKIRRKYRGDKDGTASGTSIDFKAEIAVQAAETGKWWSLSGTVVGSCIGAVLVQAINVWLGLAIAEPKILDRSMIQLIGAFAFGVTFVVTLLVLAIKFPHPTPFQYNVFRTVLALAAAGTAAMIPGLINIEVSAAAKLLIRAGGALAVFVIVFFFNPAQLAARTRK